MNGESPITAGLKHGEYKKNQSREYMAFNTCYALTALRENFGLVSTEVLSSNCNGLRYIDTYLDICAVWACLSSASSIDLKISAYWSINLRHHIAPLLAISLIPPFLSGVLSHPGKFFVRTLVVVALNSQNPALGP